MIADLGQRFELEQIALRLWPSASLIQGMNTALFDIVGKAPDRCRARAQGPHRAQPRRRSTCMAALTPTKPKFEALLSAHYTAAVDPARPRADLGAVRAGSLRRSETARASPPKRSRSAPIRAITGSQAKVDVDHGRRRDIVGALRASARLVRKIRCRAPRSSKNSAATPQGVLPDAHIADVSARSTGWRISARCAS